MLSRLFHALPRPLLLLSLAAGTAAAAPQATLKVGDPAPQLTIEKWVKGTPVTEFAEGKVYVVEFWATWCGPCIAGMPHLSQVQREWRERGVTIVSVTSEDPNNTLQGVEQMVAAKGDVMDYTVAWDQGRTTNEAWMQAAQQNGIPCCFVVGGDGKVAYIGHPMWLDIPLEGIAAGTWDPSKADEVIGAAEKRLQGIFQLLNEDMAKALEELKAFEKDFPGAAGQFVDLKLNLCLRLEQFDDAYALCAKLVDDAIAQGDAGQLNALAWLIVDPRADWKKKDVALAKRAAVKAVELTKSENADVLDTLARVHFVAGEVEKAIEVQKAACGLEPENGGLAETLAEYEAARES